MKTFIEDLKLVLLLSAVLIAAYLPIALIIY